jgi:cellulose synthase/poly-beta-1,6-N-acetylglucosamine synthase-like glycosyltransferase
MNWVDFVFYSYTFISIYMLCLFVIIYFQNRKDLFSYPKGKPEPVSLIMPCYNDGKNIGKAIESLLKLDYPKNMIEIIVVDDQSKDNSVEIVKQYVKKYKNVRLIVNKKNSGGAAQPTNIGIRAAKYDYIAVVDSDSTPERDALKKMIGFLQEDEKVGGVTCAILGKYRGGFMEKLQAIEYAVIAFTRKLLDMVDGVYVTPGPFALYKKKILKEIGMFDEKNITQDIEIVWRLIYHGYYARMCLATQTTSVTPTKFRQWFKQRIRWNIGGLQTTLKYKNIIFRKGILGFFIVPFFVASLFIGVIGIALFSYLFLRGLWTTYLATKFSIMAGTEIIKFSGLSLNLSVLNFFGVALFILGTFFTLIGLGVMNEKELRDKHWFTMVFFLLVYLTLTPILLIISIYKFARGKYSW